MDLTLVLARFWGIILIVGGASFLLNKRLLPEILKIKDKESFLFLSGFMALLVGAFHIAIYNYWEMSARGLITLFGWISLLKGIIRLAAPDFSKRSIAKVARDSSLFVSLFVILTGIGIYFLYLGYIQ